jgi:hypothetical protein
MDQSQTCTNAPVTYLHDPDTGRPFAALVTLELTKLIPSSIWETMDHDHLEGDEDEW